MKQLKIIGLLIMFVFIQACNNDSSNPIDSNFNEFSTEITIDAGDAGTLQYDMGFSYEKEGETYIILTKSIDNINYQGGFISNALVIVLNGTTEGTYQLSAQGSNENILYLNTDDNMFTATDGTVIISNYPAPGGKIDFEITASLFSTGSDMTNMDTEIISIDFFEYDYVNDKFGGSLSDDGDDGDDGDDNDEGTDKYNRNLNENLESFSMKIDGEEFNNEYVYLYDVSFVNSNYYANPGNNTVSISGGIDSDDDFVFTLSFLGQEATTYNVDIEENVDANSIQIYFYDDATDTNLGMFLKKGTIDITEYSSVGGYVIVDFSGTFYVPGQPDLEYNISEGHIKYKRT